MIYPRMFIVGSLLMIVSGYGPPKVNLPNLGYIQGTTMPGYQIKEFEAFLGIPFAQPPVGELRFTNPRPIPPWNGVYIADTPKPECIQKNYLLPTPMVSGNEDCLYLNVYRPSRAGKINKNPLPVMVYIYGGGFFSGTASPLVHGPEYFMDTGEVILVTVAYRLGALGFLSTGDYNMPGNFGLKDQNLALKWVKTYISCFGGNPDNVTIFGQSAGAVSVHMHVLSDLSTGLFQRAIVMSGNAAAPFAIPLANPLEQARKQAEFCNITSARTFNTKMLTKALRQVDAKQLVESGDRFKYWHVDPMTTFRPVIELPSPSAFLTVDPSELMASGNYAQVPWMTGLVPYEGAVRGLSIVSNEALRMSFNAHFNDLLERLMEFPLTDEDDMQEIMTSLIDYYFGGVHELNSENSQGLIDIISDRGFVHPFYRSIKDYVATADLKKNPVYLYKFNYNGPFSYSTLYTGNFKDYGVVHCDDLIYLFRSPLLFNVDFDRNSTEAKVIKELVGTYVSFAKTGKPNGMKPCTQEVLDDVGEDEFCEFKEILNKDKGFYVRTVNKFNMSGVKLWESILN